MKNIRLIQFLVIVVVSAVLILESQAAGIGVYYTIGSGSGNWSLEDGDDYIESYYDTAPMEIDVSDSGYGVVFDTNVAKNKVFNYRLCLGIENRVYKLDFSPDDEIIPADAFTEDVKINSFVIDNNFGFAFFRTPYLRLWAGPEFKISYGSGDSDRYDNISLLNIGVGPVLGLNYNIGKLFTLGAKSGILFEGAQGYGENPSGDDADFDGSNTYFYFNFSILYRFSFQD